MAHLDEHHPSSHHHHHSPHHNHHDHEEHHHHRSASASSSSSAYRYQRPINVYFENVSYSVQTKPTTTPITKASSKSSQLVADEKCILKGISGYAEPGQILAVMGPSGSGKTTLLSALSGRLKRNEGSITLNGVPLNKQLRRRIGYVLQQDIFFPDLTLRQTLVYTSLLRLPETMSYEQKLRHVDHIIDALDLRHCEQTIIGDMMKRGLSGGEKKRANIACELLTNPTILLVDEPTSGLDSSTAHSLMQTLKDYAVKEKKTVIATIHQPSSQIFYMLDKLLLLSGGQMAYFGPTHDVIGFFERVGYPISPHYNPADFIMEKIKQGPAVREKIIAAARELTWTDEHLSHTHHHHHHQHSHHRHHLKSITDHDPQEHSDLSQEHHHTDETFDEQHEDGSAEVEKEAESHDEHFNHRNRHHHHHHHHHAEDVHELRILIDPKTCPLIKNPTELIDEKQENPQISSSSNASSTGNDDDSGRSSLCETDGSSASSTVSRLSRSCSTSSCEEDVLHNNNHHHHHHHHKHRSHHRHRNAQPKWPTSFLTQLRVLTSRNFYEARGRMLSKLNWIQTIGLGIVCGMIWFQVKRSEDTLSDIRGWMFFSTTYWMLFAMFGALISFPAERQVVNKERASGAYRLSSYYVAKMIGELPLTLTLPSMFHLISYPALGCHSVATFFWLWLFLILNTLVAQSVGLFIGAACYDLEMSVTISALYSLSSSLFGGFYSNSIPPSLAWMRYLSMVHYAFVNMQMIEFSTGPPVTCSPINSRFTSCLRQLNSTTTTPNNLDKIHISSIEPPTVEYDELLRTMDIMSNGSPPFPVWVNTLVLLFFLVGFRLSGYLILRFGRRPK